MKDRVFKLLFDEDDVTWQSILYSLVRDDGMDPWDVDIAAIAQKFMERLKQLRETDFRFSGKIILAAAILLKIKSKRLVGEDINDLDALIASTDEEELAEEFYDSLERDMHRKGQPLAAQPHLIPRTPQQRKRKVSIYDLVDALEMALDTKKRRVLNTIPAGQFDYTPRKMDIGLVIRQIYAKILDHFKEQPKLTFSQLLPDKASKEDKVYTFIPLLQLDALRKIDLQQEQHFGEVQVELLHNKKSIDKGLST